MDNTDEPPRPRKPWKKAQCPQAGSLFLNLPLDIQKVIADHLYPARAAALSLTCQAALAVFKPKSPLRACERTALRLRLERDLSRNHYFCWNCQQLHHYAKHWQARLGWPEDMMWSPCANRLVGIHMVGAWCVGFHHFQLVMNEHYYGPGRGLPAESILEAGRMKDWYVQPTIAIFEGQCFLSVQYDLRLSGIREANEAALFQDTPTLLFCKHLVTSPDVWGDAHAMWRRGLHEFRELRDRFLFQQVWREEGEIQIGKQESCRACLTDYMFEMAQLPQLLDPGKKILEIKVVTYHQLGVCRKPDDWMWEAFTSSEPTINRERWWGWGKVSLCPPGEVKARWDTGHAVGRVKRRRETMARVGSGV